MANKTPTKTSFSKDNQPKKGRGKSERTKILEAMERQAKTEEGFYDELITRAFNPDDNFTFKEVLSRMSPIPKAVAPFVEFTFDKKADLHLQAGQVLDAVSKGKIPPDIGASIISGISSIVKIKEVTVIDESLKRMEKHLDSQK